MNKHHECGPLTVTRDEAVSRPLERGLRRVAGCVGVSQHRQRPRDYSRQPQHASHDHALTQMRESNKATVETVDSPCVANAVACWLYYHKFLNHQV